MKAEFLSFLMVCGSGGIKLSCRILRELKNIVVVARWSCIVTGGDWMQYAAGSVGTLDVSFAVGDWLLLL